MLATERKQEIIGKFKSHETDTGSPEVQIALLSERIVTLTEHSVPTRRIITHAAACSRWSASAVACSTI